MATFAHLRRTAALTGWFLAVAISPAPGAPFNIAEQPAPAALELFIKQSGTEVFFGFDQLQSVRTQAIQGEYSSEQALSLMLTGTPFKATAQGSKKFVISSTLEKRGSVEGVVRSEASGRGVTGARVALTGTDRVVFTDKRGRFVFDDVPPGVQELEISAEGLRQARVTDVTIKSGNRYTLSPIVIPTQPQGVLQLQSYTVSAKKNDVVLELDPYAVEDTRPKPFVSGNMDLARTIDDAQPYYIFDARTIDQSGATDVEDFLKQRLTMNTTALSNEQVSGDNRSGNLSTVNLRGVGTDKTLILVNGRRVSGVAMGLAELQPDLNGIPLSAIDRIEVLPSSASGIYGGSAIGGVVNVILKRNYSGSEVRATYDNTWDTDAPRRTVSLSYGSGFNQGKSHFSVSAAWSDTTPLVMEERRGIFEDKMRQIQGNVPTFFYSGTSPWLGALPNILPNSSAVTTLTLKNGVSLNSRNTHVSAGINASSTTAELQAALLANAGVWNFAFPDTVQSPSGLKRQLGVQPTSRSIQASLRHQLFPKLELYADGAYSERHTDAAINSFSGAFVVPALSPVNPFTTDIRVRFPNALVMPVVTDVASRRASLGATLTMPREWIMVLDATVSESRFGYQTKALDDRAVTADLGSGALNLFVDTLSHSPDLSKYVQTLGYGGSSWLYDITGKAAGALPALPWGQPTLAIGLSHRVSGTPQREFFQDYPISKTFSMRTLYFARQASTDSAYLETSIPLVKQGWLPVVHSLELQASGRGEYYKVDTGSTALMNLNLTRIPPRWVADPSTPDGLPIFSTDTYNSTNYTVGLKYQPIKTITLRASRASAFLPPTADQLTDSPFYTSDTIFVNDPKTGQTNVAVYPREGGNSSLKPQTSRSTNLGIIWVPEWKPLKGLRLNAEYYRIEQFNAIGTLAAQSIVNQEDSYPGRVVRNATGRITSVDYSSVNLYLRETEGWDFTLNYRLNTPVGAFSLQAAQSIILHLKTQYSLAKPQYDAAGYHPGEEGAAKYKSNAFLGWDWRQWTAGWTVRGTSSYKQYGAAGGPNSQRSANGGPYLPNSYLLPQGGDTIPAQAYHDFFVGYAFGSDVGAEAAKAKWKKLGRNLLDGLTVQVGARNVFDRVPPLDVYYASTFYFSPYGDTRLRSYWLSVRKAF